ncbi:MAG: type II toxin-antitoxin system RelE family toxin [Dehalococcoidia bacterium]|nr:hypothetical protein [Chloroflexota bacterium]
MKIVAAIPCFNTEPSIVENPYSGKPLRRVLRGKRRVHIGHFVLLYGIKEKERKIIFLEFAHHDEVYK